MSALLVSTLAGWSTDVTLGAVVAFGVLAAGLAIGSYFALARVPWRRKLALWGGATAVFVVLQFFTTAWPSNWDNAASQCLRQGSSQATFVRIPGTRRANGSGLARGPIGHLQRFPPGVRCAQPNGGDYFLFASATSWAGLVGYSAAFGLLAAEFLVVLQTLRWRQRRPHARIPSPPFKAREVR